MARSLAQEGRREAGRLTALADRARRINEAGYAAEFDKASAATAAVAATVETASLYWVAAPMARLAMDASQDIPAINGVDAPAQAGLMVMAEPLPLLGHQSNWLVPFTRLRTLIPASLDAAQAVGPDGAPVDPAHVGVMAWLQARLASYARSNPATPGPTTPSAVATTTPPTTTV
jgi:hypothetical protein